MKRASHFLLCSFFACTAAAESGSLRVWTAQPPAAEAGNPADEAVATAPDAQVQKLLGASVVIDPAHIAETIKNIQQGYERYLQLLELVSRAEQNLDKLVRVPFVDDENYTGAFLANMHWLLAGGNYDERNPALVEETLGYSHPEIIELLGEYFPGPRIVAGSSAEPQLRPDPWETWENPAELYFARDNAMLSTAYRIAEILANHAAQVSRERQGIASQRNLIDGADGNAAHLEMLFAAAHQSLDAQTVERQVKLLGANLEYLAFADRINARLEERTRAWHHLTALGESLEVESLTSAGGTPLGFHP